MKKINTQNCIADIEAEIKTAKAEGLNTKAKKAKYNQLKSRLNKLYAENKALIMKFEETNYEYLALMRSTGGYYKMFGHSALFYVNSIAVKLGLKANMQTDGDYTAKSENGFVSVKDLEKLEGALKTINVHKAQTKNRGGDFVLFKLPWKFTEKQLKDYVDNNDYKMRHFNHVVMVDNVMPALFIQLEELTKAIYENVRNMPSIIEREGFGYEMIDKSIEMVHLYMDLTNGLTDKKECLDKIKLKLKYIKYRTKILADLKIWQPKTSARIGDIIIKIQDIVTKESKNI